MLVKELIAKLQELPEHLQDAPVLIDTDKRIDDVYENIEVIDMTFLEGRYVPSNMLYDYMRNSADSFSAVLLGLS